MGSKRRQVNGRWEHWVESFDFMSEEFGHERKDRLSFSKNRGVVVSREDFSFVCFMTAVESRREGDQLC